MMISSRFKIHDCIIDRKVKATVFLIFLFFVLQDTKVMSWWDYGYQITAMANRTILVDNNTWNNTHISRVGQVSMIQESDDWSQTNLILQFWIIVLRLGFRNLSLGRVLGTNSH